MGLAKPPEPPHNRWVLGKDPKPAPAPVSLTGREVIIETRLVGAYAQVRAVDAATGVEVAVTAPSTISDLDGKRLAMGKLSRALARYLAEQKANGRSGGGIVI